MAKQSFNIVRHAGDPKSATTLWGRDVVRKSKLFVKEWNADVQVTPYDNHFIYATDVTKRGMPSFMCTCGGPAVIVNPGDPERRMFVCLIHAQTGRHTMSS